MKFILIIIFLSSPAYSQVSFEDYLKLKDALYMAFDELKVDSTHTLEINQPVQGFEHFWWDQPILRASYSEYSSNGIQNHFIFIFGGLAKMLDMTLDGLALIACHELGHGLGGAPYKDSGSSQEGQADYYATKTCLPVLFKYLVSPIQDYEVRAMEALKSSIAFYKINGDITSISTPSTEIATKLDSRDFFYPSAQCRLDTSINGIFQKERPVCWYPNNKF